MANLRSTKPRGSHSRDDSLLSPKHSVRVGCWNVRSLGNPTRQNTRLRNVLRTMSEKNVHLLALSEVRWPGHGVSWIDGKLIVYSGSPVEDPHHRRRGVAVVMSERAASAWKFAGSVFDPSSERLLRLRLKSHSGFLSIIAVYAPTNELANEEESIAFYEELQECVRQVPRGDMLMIMGDFNARVGNDVAAWRGTIGHFGPEEQNENGVRLLDFCALNGLVVTNTLFQHRQCHKMTWYHPAERSRPNNGHVLDYILVNQRFRSSILDTRVYRNTYLDSDHRLLVSRLRLKLKARRRRAQRFPKFQVDARYLEGHQVFEFRSLLTERIAAVPKGDVEEAWSTLKDSLLSAQSNLPVVSEKVEEDWVTDAVREASKQKREAWMRWQKFPGDDALRLHYHQLKAQSREVADKAREEWWERKAAHAERLYESAVRLGRGGSLLKDLRLLQQSQKLRAGSTLCAQDGTQLSSSGEKLERWREHFKQVSNISTQLVPSVVTEVLGEPIAPAVDDDSFCGVPTEDEIRAALHSLKNGKAPGEDGIQGELLKLGGEVVVQSLTHLASLVWETEAVPADWLKQLTIPLYKKGSTQDCDNYRGIALLSVPGKVFCRVVQMRLAERAEQLLRENQCGFRKGRGCID